MRSQVLAAGALLVLSTAASAQPDAGREAFRALYEQLVEIDSSPTTGSCTKAVRAAEARLKAAGIPTAVYYPKPLHLQKAFASLGHRPGDFPVSESLSAKVFSLPMHPYLTPEDQNTVARAFAK